MIVFAFLEKYKMENEKNVDTINEWSDGKRENLFLFFLFLSIHAFFQT